MNLLPVEMTSAIVERVSSPEDLVHLHLACRATVPCISDIALSQFLSRKKTTQKTMKTLPMLGCSLSVVKRRLSNRTHCFGCGFRRVTTPALWSAAPLCLPCAQNRFALLETSDLRTPWAKKTFPTLHALRVHELEPLFGSMSNRYGRHYFLEQLLLRYERNKETSSL